MTAAAAGREHMLHALRLAERGWGHVHPNPMVGAVVVRDGEVIGEGWHQQFGGPHAEVEALRAAGERAAGATLFVTLEPCSHHGRTPPCTDAIAAAGIARVVFAAEDPNPTAAGGAAVLRTRGIHVDGGIERAAARALNAVFHYTHEYARPYVALKLALSLDGRISTAAGSPTQLTGAEATAEVHRLRTGFDAVMVGIGTVLADDPLLTVRAAPAGRIPPTRVILDTRLRLPPGGHIAATAGDVPVLVLCGAGPPPAAVRALEECGVTVLPLASPASSDPGGLPVPAVLDALWQRGIRSVFCEGGANLAGSLMREAAVQRLILFYASVLLGASAVPAFAGYQGRLEPPAWGPPLARQFGRDLCVTLDWTAD